MNLRSLVFFIFSFCSLTVFPQVPFEKGFFVDLSGSRVDCFIRNMDWNNNPSQFEYKLTQLGEVKIMDAHSISEFGVGNFPRYVGKRVKIDRSTDRIDSMDYGRAPVWSEAHLLLKVLVEGKASLYYYQEEGLARFFYKANDSEIQQLIYKKYLFMAPADQFSPTSEKKIATNSDFHQQLFQNVNCKQSTNSVKRLFYDTESLVRYFNQYNACIDGKEIPGPATINSGTAFEKGFFVDLSGSRVDCFIRNRDWNNNPSQFEYKLTQAGEVRIMDAHSVSEFGVGNFPRYVGKRVKIDRSTDRIDSMDYGRAPVWSEEHLMLKVLVEGKASLYYYQEESLARFFYKANDSEIQQLIYKKYLFMAPADQFSPTSEKKIATNSDFHQQLFQNVNCKQSTNSVKRLFYDAESLVRYFNHYNDCSDGKEIADLSTIKKGSRIGVKLKSGLDFATFRFTELTSAGMESFDLAFKVTFRIGAEVEYILPSKRNSWSFLLDPSFQHYDDNNGTGFVKYKSIEIPFGGRHYFVLDEKTRLFLDAFLVWDAPYWTEVRLDNEVSIPLESLTVAYGGGLNAGKFSIELRHYSSRGMGAATFYSPTYHKTSLVLGYRLF